MASTTTSQPSLSFPRATFAKLSPHPYLLAHLQPSASTAAPSRANGRSPAQFRTPNINTGSLTHANGSAVVRVGDTTVVCGIRGEILPATSVPGYRAPSPTSPLSHNEAADLDLLVPNIELATGCSPAFLPGQPPSTLAQSLSTRVYSLLHSSRLVAAEDLRIWYQPPTSTETAGPSSMALDDGDEEFVAEEEPEAEVKAFWTLYIDIMFISLDGNPFDAAWAAVLSALRDVRLPRAYWDADREMVLCSDAEAETKKLTLSGMPVASTFAIFKAQQQVGRTGKGHWVLADPDTFEEGLCDEVVTVVVDGTESGGEDVRVLGLSKSGGTVAGKQEMRELVRGAGGRWQEWAQVLKG